MRIILSVNTGPGSGYTDIRAVAARRGGDVSSLPTCGHSHRANNEISRHKIITLTTVIGMRLINCVFMYHSVCLNRFLSVKALVSNFIFECSATPNTTAKYR